MKLGSSAESASSAHADGGVSLGAGASHSVRARGGVRDDAVELRCWRGARSSPPLPASPRAAAHTAVERRAGPAARMRPRAALRATRAVRAAVRRVRQHRRASVLSVAHLRCSRALSSAMAFAALQEGVFKCVCAQTLASAARRASRQATALTRARRIDGFRYGGWMTFVTSAWFCVCSGLELLVSGETQRRGSWRVRCVQVLHCRRSDAPAACRITARWRR